MSFRVKGLRCRVRVGVQTWAALILSVELPRELGLGLGLGSALGLGLGLVLVLVFKVHG